MNRALPLGRRGFFGALAIATAAPVAPRRIYSFLWNKSLIVVVNEVRLYKVWRPHSAAPVVSETIRVFRPRHFTRAEFEERIEGGRRGGYDPVPWLYARDVP